MNQYVISAVNEQKWSKAQNLEFEWWANLDFQAIYRVYAFTHLMMNYFGISLDQPEKVIIDVGCGPVPRISLFRQATLIGLDPLLERYKQLPYQTLEKLNQSFSVPVEQMVPALEEKADFLLSINVLDHSYDVNAFLENCSHYLKPYGLFLLSFDLHPEIDDLHPLCIDDTTALQVCTQYFDIESFVLGLPWKNRDSYHRDKTSKAITILLSKKGSSSWWKQSRIEANDPVSKSDEFLHLLEAKMYALQDPAPTYPSIHRMLKVVDAALGVLEFYPLKLYRHLRKR